MNTQKTFHKQSGTFLGAIAANMPAELSVDQMQFLIEKPEELKKRLAVFLPTFRELMGRIKGMTASSCLELHPGWDFLILHSSSYPEVGIAVSDRSGTCGKGLRLAIPNGNGFERFYSPSLCFSRWSDQLASLRQYRGNKSEEDIRRLSMEEGAQMFLKACKEKGIKFFLVHGWYSHFLSQYHESTDMPIIIDPYKNEEMGRLDWTRFLSAFGWIKTWSVLNKEHLCDLTSSLFNI